MGYLLCSFQHSKLRGKQIPLLARFANRATPPSKALSKIYKQRALKFPAQPIVELIHVIVTYPIGSLVVLSTSEGGLALEQNLHERLSPKVAVVTCSCKVVLKRPLVVDLANPGKSKIDPPIVSSCRSENSAKYLGEGKDLDPRKYSLSFFGKRAGIGSFAVPI